MYIKRFLQTNDLGIEALQIFGYLENTVVLENNNWSLTQLSAEKLPLFLSLPLHE